MSESILNISGVSKKYHRGDRSFFALKDISFSVSEAELVYIVGRSGSGKSTLLQILAGILSADSGMVEIFGQDIAKMKDDELSHLRGLQIGYVPQSLGTMPNLTVLENAELPAHLNKVNDGFTKERALMLLDLVGLALLKENFPRSLSGGELKRLLLARALMNSPKILLADELTADLDKQTASDIVQILQRQQEKGLTIIMVTHDEDLIRKNDRILRLEDGVIV